MKSVRVVYTPFPNLKKTIEMAAGQVSYHSEKAVRRVKVEKDKAVIKRVIKTKTEE